jgi:UDP-N-acetylmuramyl pentapeptide phosphotransferase/UDP-N-acetylglucosamine-1-phosphate transferase
MLLCFVAFITSVIVSIFIVRRTAAGRSTAADNGCEPQALHLSVTPRIGGLALFLALVLATLSAAVQRHKHVADLLALVGVVGPVFVAGLLEDFTKRVRPLVRLLAALLSAALAIAYLGVIANRTELAWMDRALQWAPLAWGLTALAVAGMSHATNIIDGLNGLAAFVSMMMFASLAYVSLLVGDTLVLAVALVMIGAIAGFFIWNFPAGFIFLGDGGAYLLGFVLAVCGLLMVARHPQVSAWYPVLLFIYPIFETLFSAYRRRRRRRGSVAAPDAVHLHSLIYKRLMRLFLGNNTTRQVTRRNSMTSPYLWLLAGMAVAPATLLWRHTVPLMGLCLLFCVSYVWLYLRIVRFRTPVWLLAPQRDPGP